MERFAILVDSSADLTQQEYDAMHIDGFIPLSFSIDGKEYLSYPDERELTAGELYATLRNTKAVVGTSQPNPGRIEAAFREQLDQGRDVLYIAFSSGLSGTCPSAKLVAEELREQYPGRKLFVVDTLCACCGVAMLIAGTGWRRTNSESVTGSSPMTSVTSTGAGGFRRPAPLSAPHWGSSPSSRSTTRASSSSGKKFGAKTMSMPGWPNT